MSSLSQRLHSVTTSISLTRPHARLHHAAYTRRSRLYNWLYSQLYLVQTILPRDAMLAQGTVGNLLAKCGIMLPVPWSLVF